jgi:glycosyltransferase involved in cell wall biosynthesis
MPSSRSTTSKIEAGGTTRAHRHPAHRRGFRVLYVIDSLAIGGAERSLASLAPLLVAGGVELTVVALHRRNGLRDELRAAGAHVVELQGGNRITWPQQLAGIIRTVQPELVHTTLFESNVAGRVAARWTGRPVVSSLVNETYGHDHVHDPSLTPWRVHAARAVDATTSRLVVRFHAVSERVGDVAAERLHLDRGRIDVVPRGRDPAVLGRRSTQRRASAREALRIADDARVVLAVGRQEHQKGLDVLLEAVARPEADHLQLLVAGRAGSATSRLQEGVARLGLERRVTFLGERDDVAELLCAADVFVLASRREGMPGALLDAMALEVPVVASDLPQIREVVGAEAPWLVPPERPDDLALALGAAAEPSEVRSRSVDLSRRRFEARYTTQAVSTAMLAFYERALSRSPTRG